MAVVKPVTVDDLGRAYAEAIHSEPDVRQLWAKPGRDEVEFWLLVSETTDLETELRLYEADLLVHDRFPDTATFLHVVNPRHYPRFDPDEVIPAGAKEIALCPRSDGSADARPPDQGGA